MERPIGLVVEQVLVRLPITDEELESDRSKQRRSGTKPTPPRAWTYKAFSARHLGRQLHAQLFGILEFDECMAIAAAVRAELARRLVTITPTTTHKGMTGHAELEQTPRFVGVLKHAQPTNGLRHYIGLATIRDLVLGELNRIGRAPGGGGSARFRAADVVYALSTHGRIEPVIDLSRDDKSRDSLVEPMGVDPNEQWKTAEDFLAWLEKRYDDLPELNRRKPHARAGENETWWRPISPPATIPESVIKRHAKLRRRGVPEPFLDPSENDGDDVLKRAVTLEAALTRTLGPRAAYAALTKQAVKYNPSGLDAVGAELHGDERRQRAQRERDTSDAAIIPALAGVPYEQFIPAKLYLSVEGALSGRDVGEEATENTVAWVLWTLVGQDVVLTSQLGSAVAECLRRLDDIAYLRWIIVAKEMRVTSIQREAAGLVAYPSPRLKFSSSSIRPARPVTPPVEGRGD